ncbi:MAG: metallophosphoesterase family protein, partial [Verrucomicrobiota bacterium]
DHVQLHGPYVELEFGGRNVALNHYPEIAKRIAQSGELDAVFSGHDHLKYLHQFNDTIWANPGEIMGRFGEPSFGLYDTTDGAFQHVDLRT